MHGVVEVEEVEVVEVVEVVAVVEVVEEAGGERACVDERRVLAAAAAHDIRPTHAEIKDGRVKLAVDCRI